MNTHARNARLCLGGAVICVLFLIETFVAHQSRPNNASPYAWSILGAVALVLLVLARPGSTRSPGHSQASNGAIGVAMAGINSPSSLKLNPESDAIL